MNSHWGLSRWLSLWCLVSHLAISKVPVVKLRNSQWRRAVAMINTPMGVAPSTFQVVYIMMYYDVFILFSAYFSPAPLQWFLDFESIWELTADRKPVPECVKAGSSNYTRGGSRVKRRNWLVGLVDWMINTNELNDNKNQKFMLCNFDDTNATDQRYWVILQ